MSSIELHPAAEQLYNLQSWPNQGEPRGYYFTTSVDQLEDLGRSVAAAFLDLWKAVRGKILVEEWSAQDHQPKHTEIETWLGELVVLAEEEIPGELNPKFLAHDITNKYVSDASGRLVCAIGQHQDEDGPPFSHGARLEIRDSRSVNNHYRED